MTDLYVNYNRGILNEKLFVNCLSKLYEYFAWQNKI